MTKYFGMLIISIFLLQGCYTIIWDPMTMEFPREDNSVTTPTYYEEVDYYGRYSSYYNVPWWYSISPPSTFRVEPSSADNKNKSVESLRDSNGGRNSAGRDNNFVSPPSRSSSGSSSTSGSNSETKTNSTSKEETPSKRESNKSNDTRQTRTDGERSSEPKRR